MSRDVEVLRRMREELIGPDPTDKWRAETEALDSASERISSLEGVLREIRARCHRKDNQLAPFSALADIARLVTETLDPHKPWCRDERHQGPCLSDQEERDDGE